MRNSGFPVLYVAELTSVSSSGGTASTVVNFNDGGTIRSIAFAAIDSTGAAIASDAFTLNIYRQNQKGLTTQAAIASTITVKPNNTTGGGGLFTLPPMMGDFKVTNLDQLVVTVVNKSTSTTADLINVVFYLHAEN